MGHSHHVGALALFRMREAEEALQHAAAARQQGEDSEEAQWLRQAAALGEARAQTRIGFLYQVGRGVPQDYTQALYWYRRAAKQGQAEAQYHLGRLYEYGWGVPQSYVRSLYWYWRAARAYRNHEASPATIAP
jgi:TPR repeat protein